MKESKLTKYTLLGCTLVLIAYFATSARADEAGDVAQIASICAGTNALVAQKTTHEFAAQQIQVQADWWFSFLEEWVGDKDFAMTLTTNVMRDIQVKYNSGALEWTALVDVGRQCAMARIEIEEESADE